MTQATAGEIVTEIMMSRDNLSWLAVEGYSDEILLRSRNFSNPVKIVVGQGWEGVRDILVEHSKIKASSVVVGLVDRDYRDHCGRQLTVGTIVLTDMRDIENMMFNSSALVRVLSEHASIHKIPSQADGKIDAQSIRAQIYSAATQIGRLRIYCEQNNFYISFKDIDHKKIICDRTLTIDVPALLAHINGKNIGKKTLTSADWTTAQTLQWPGNLNQDEFISNGHDVMAIVALTLRRMWGTLGGKIDGDAMECFFRIGYSDSDLQNTQMWAELERCIQ